MLISSRADRLRRLCICGISVTAAMMLSYLESLLPLQLLLPLPGFKPGLANTVTVMLFAAFSRRDAAVVSAVRILLMGLLFGSPVSLFFSACGGLLAFLSLLLAARLLRGCSHVGVCVLCAAAHNLGQLLAASILFGAGILLSYLPLLLIAATVSGTLTGLLLNLAMPRLQKLAKSR